MAEEQPAAEEQAPEAGSEDAFFGRIQSMLDASLSDERIGRAFDAWAAGISSELDAEEEQEGKAPKRPQTKEAKEDGETEERLEEPEQPSRAERGRASGGVGPGSRSGYWERVGRGILYGNRGR